MAGIFDLGLYTAGEFSIALAIICAAGIVRGFTGFGSGLVMVPLLSLLWGPVEALATMVALGIFSTFQLVPGAVRHTNWRDTGPMLATSAIASPIGTMLLISLDPEIVKKIIAALVLGLTLITLRGWSYKGPRGPLPSAIAGGMAGLINGVAGVGGPPMVLYLISLPEKPQTHRANIVIAMALTSFIVLLSMLVAGVIGSRVITHVVVFVLPSLGAVWLGAWLFKKAPSRVFRLVVLWFLVAISVAILFR